jgi:hypothetical protein
MMLASAISAAQSPMVVGASSATVLRAGTSVPLRTVTELTTNGKKLKVGDRFDLEVSEPVSLNGQIVIPVGSRAVGEVTSVRNKGMWGKSGNIDARVLFVRANDKQIRMTGALNDKGKTGTAGVVGAVALVPIAGFFVTGTSAAIAPGTQVTGYLDEDVPVAFAPGMASASPMVIITPPAAPASPIVKASTVTTEN